MMCLVMKQQTKLKMRGSNDTHEGIRKKTDSKRDSSTFSSMQSVLKRNSIDQVDIFFLFQKEFLQMHLFALHSNQEERMIC